MPKGKFVKPVTFVSGIWWHLADSGNWFAVTVKKKANVFFFSLISMACFPGTVLAHTRENVIKTDCSLSLTAVYKSQNYWLCQVVQVAPLLAFIMSQLFLTIHLFTSMIPH